MALALKFTECQASGLGRLAPTGAGDTRVRIGSGSDYEDFRSKFLALSGDFPSFPPTERNLS